MQVLIVDDDDFALEILDNTLSRLGYSAVKARHGAEALEILRGGDIRLVVTDWEMPGMNGIELCRFIRREDLTGYVYIIMLTGREGKKQRMEGLCAGADDFLNKPLDPEELIVCLKGAERILSLETRDLALFALAKLAESRDPETGSHVERVQNYARLVGQHLSAEVKTCYGVDDDYIRLLYQTSPLHDLGKVAIPDNILLKPGLLTPEEFAIMKTHTVVGARTLDAALHRFPNVRFLQIARDIAATHHEHFDGSGYPQGLAGEQIPLCGRIVAVADAYDALTSHRVHKEAISHEQAKAILLHDRGSQFDPEVVNAFMRAETQILAVKNRLRDQDELISQQIAIPAPPDASQCVATPTKILVVEDDPLLLRVLNRLLSATGEPVFTATNGEEALKVLAEEGPRVIVSDWVMPKIDGVELCRCIRSGNTGNTVHFIMLTAHSEKSRLLDAYEAGADDFVAKPFDPCELLARVRGGIRVAKLHDELVLKAAGSKVLNAQLAVLNSRLERLSITDELTGLFNRRHAMLRLEENWALAERYGRPMSIAMIDVDNFKKINDVQGHEAGDAMLRQLAEILREQTRATDTACRIGGEEFLIIFPCQTIEEVYVQAERCRNAVEAHAFNVGGTALSATISIGIATRARGMSQFPDLLRLADQALYTAKHAGRNMVQIAEEPKEQTYIADSLTVALDRNSEEVEPERLPIDMAAVLKRCGGDAEFADSVIERFRVQGVREVGRITQALAEGDGEGLYRLAHNVKSMAAFVAADTVSDLAKQVEDFARGKELAQVPPLLVRLREEIDILTAWLTETAIKDEAIHLLNPVGLDSPSVIGIAGTDVANPTPIE